MKLFDDWEKHKNEVVSKHLLWDCKLEDFDWQKGRKIVVQRVVERGKQNDFYAAINLYGGLENFIHIVKNEVPYFPKEDIPFICAVFGLKETELWCYKRQQLRATYLSS